MIKIQQPAMALNSHDVPGAKYEMWNTWNVPKEETLDHMVTWIAALAGTTPSGRLNCLILNCHGYYGPGVGGRMSGGYGLKMGKGIYRRDTGKFAKLKGKVTEIWITACGTARISNPGTAGDGDGNLLCQEIAKAAGAYVVAATTHQVGAITLPFGYIDGWEGLVVRYDPAGICVEKKEHARGTIDGWMNGWD